MKKTLVKIGDLITVPPVETVIQLTAADSRNQNMSRDLLSSFVLTDEIEKAYQQLFQSVLKKQGVGAFVKGNYGSGKSHFLAVLSLLLESNHCWQYLTHPLLEEFHNVKEQKLLVIKIALHNYSSKVPLESIVFEETQKTLTDQTGHPVYLQSGALLIKHFNRYILPRHTEFLTTVNHSPETWKRLCGTNIEQATEIITVFIRSKKIPLKVQFDRRQSIETLVSVLKNEKFSGVLFAVDELSEFLKSKNDTAAFTEDLRFLQFMGEVCKQQPYYFVTTLQENIEQTGYIEEDIVYRIKDRFPYRFSLSAHHVNQLITRRLVHKNRGSTSEIQTIYNQYHKSFPQIEIGSQEFIEIYPVHPDTVSILEGLTPLFSQHRGVVDFIYHQLTGDENRQWQGMLLFPANHLMTPDTIFDHFRERIKEHPELAAYSEVVFKTLTREIPIIFKSTDDRRIALKIVKILILIEISPLEKRPTIRKLAQMVNEPVSDLEENLNYQYLEGVILDRLIKEGSFVSQSKTVSGDTVYFISLEQTVNQMVRNQVNEILKLPHSIEEIFQSLFSFLRNSMIPFTFLSGGQRKKYTIKWQNTQRDGFVYLKTQLPVGQIELETIIQQLKTTESDFVLIIGGVSENSFTERPAFGFEQLEGRFSDAIIGWLPRNLKEDERQFLRKYYAYSQVSIQLGQKNNPQDRQMRTIVKEWLDAHSNELVTVVEDIYYGGRIADKTGWVSFRFSLLYPGFKQLIQQIISPLLQNFYPRHSEVMPNDIMQPFAVDKLFVQFIRPGKISKTEAKSQHLDNLIKAYLSPLSLVQSVAEDFILTTQFNENELGANVVANCIGDKPTDLFSLYWLLRKGTWGLTKYQFQLLISALIASGRLSAFQAGNVVTLRSISQLSDGNIDAIGEGKLISEELQHTLKPFFVLEEFLDIPEHFSVSTQEQIWRRMKQLRDHLVTAQNQLFSMTSRYEAYPAFHSIVTAVAPDHELLKQFENSIRVSYPAREGLDKIAQEISMEHFRRIPEEIQKLQELITIFRTHFAELNQMYTYLNHPSLSKAINDANLPFSKSYKHLYHQVDNCELGEVAKISDFSQQYYDFKDHYIEWYTKEHETYYSSEIFQTSIKIESEPPVQLLKRFHRLETVITSPDWVTIQEEILSLESPCRFGVHSCLATSPVCRCGYIPGQNLPPSKKDTILKQAEEGIRDVLQQLQSTFRWVIEEYMTNLRQIGKVEIADQLTKLLTFPADQAVQHYSRLGKIVTERVIDAINSAIRGKILILQRPVNTLIEKLSGKQLKVGAIRKAFETWLTEGEHVDNETHVHIISDQELPVLDQGPYHAVESVIHEEGIRFFEAFWLLAWAVQHGKELWTNWISEKYRLGSTDQGLISSITEELFGTEDSNKMAIYFNRIQLTSRLEQLIDIGKMTLRELQDYITKETLLEPLSLTATKSILNKIAPSEPLTKETGNFLRLLRSHPCREQWPHLAILVQHLSVINIVSQGETATNRMAHFLSEGWSLSGLLGDVKQKNTIIDLIPENRLKLLSNRVHRFQERLIFKKGTITKKEIAIPYITIKKFPNGLITRLKNTSVVLLIVDAMRWDIWEGLRFGIQKNLPNHKLDYLAAMEVSSPTTTEVNRPLLIRQLVDIVGALDWHLETVSEDLSKQEKVQEALQHNQDLVVLNTTIVDSLLHERKEPFPTMLDIINTRMEALMSPILRAIRPSSTVVITADHGFVESNGDYTHGGNSYYEMIVPFSLWKQTTE